MRFLRACLAFVFLALAMVLPMQAFAEVIATSTTTTTSIDASPFLVNLASVVSSAFLPVVGTIIFLAAQRLQRWIGIQATAAEEAALRDSVDQALFHAASFARARIGAAGQIPIDLKSAAIAEAAGYAMRSIPDTLAKIGIMDAASERLAEMIEARFDLLAPATAAN